MILQLANTTKSTLLEKTLETAYTVSDFYRALQNGKPLPRKRFPSLEEALRSHRILNDYTQQANLSLKGIKLVNSKLDESQIVWTWQQLYRQTAAKPFAGKTILTH